MKSLVNEIISPILEELNQDYVVYFDVDDTLADYTQNLSTFIIKDPETGEDRKIKPQDTVENIDFWLNAKLIPGAKEMVDFSKSNFGKVEILSAVPELSKVNKELTGKRFYDAPIDGKTEWVSKNIGPLSMNWSKNGKEKGMWASPTSILVDDKPENIKAFQQAGGIGILMDSPQNVITQLKKLFNPMLNENATYSKNIDYKAKIKELTKYMLDKGEKITPLPKIVFKHGDNNNAKDFYGMTAYYDPKSQTIVLYTEGRHPKDIVRSFSHEMVHHKQNLEGRLGNVNTQNTTEDDHLNKIEKEAYLDGNITFRNWTDQRPKNNDLQSLEEGIIDKTKELFSNFKIAYQEQKKDFQGFNRLFTKYIKRQELTPEEKDKLVRNVIDIFKMSSIPVLGVSGTTLLGTLSNFLSKGKFSTLPSKFKDKLLPVNEIIPSKENVLDSFSRALETDIVDFKKLNENLNEVGEANIEPYKWEEINSGRTTSVEFITPSETKYEVDLTHIEIDDPKDEDMYLEALDIEFLAKPKGAEGSSSKIVVNKGELYRVMSTISHIIKYYLRKSRGNIKAILYSPSKKSSEEEFGNQRDNLYRAFISKAFPGAEIKQQGEYIITYLPGNAIVPETKSKDPFGLNAYALELARGLEESLEEGHPKKKDPKKGTGKKPEGSGRRLYTDEDPKDTVRIKFKTKEDIVDTLNKKQFKAKSHARQSQVINLIHQRVRAAYGKAKDPEVKSRLKRALDYIESRKESSKAKTERLKKQKLNEQKQDIKFKLPKLNYSYSSLQPYIDKETMEEHFDKHFKGYTDKLNAELDEKSIRVNAEDQIQAIQIILGKYPKNNIIKNNGGGFYNHVLYFENMTPDYKAPSTKFRKMLEENFNSFSEFKEQFKEAGLKQFGSGWIFLIKKENKLVIESYANQDNPYLDKDFKGKILIAMDVWEHSYYLKHKSQRENYINDFFRVIDYKVAEERLKEELITENVAPNHTGKSSPFGSGYNPVKEKTIFNNQLDLEELVTATDIICDNCGWEWAIKDGGDDLFICHKCEHDNTPKPNKLVQGLEEELTKVDLDQIEKIADEWFEDYGIDIEFTYHFLERVNDPRNGKPISPEELEDIFTQAAEKYGMKLSQLPDNFQAVLFKLRSDINVPFAINYDEKNDEIDLVAKTIMRKKDFKTTNPKLTLEGRYDTITNQISSAVFRQWKEDFNKGKKESRFEDTFESDDIFVDVDANLSFIKGLDKLTVDGGADSETEYLEIRFEIDPSFLPEYWEEISFNLKDVIRHEIEHLTHGEGFNLNPSKFIEDDMFFRKMIDADLLPRAEYFKLEKEIDANLQGMYLRAKKEKRPFKDVIDFYLDSQNITPEEKEEILNLWRRRAKSLSLPVFENKLNEYSLDSYTIYCDMDGVLSNFDSRFEQFSDNIPPKEYENSFGSKNFWDLIDKKVGIKFWAGMEWMSDGKTLWDYISKHNPIILSAPSARPESKIGKRIWMKRNLPGAKLILAKRENKQNYADKSNILIDDRPDNIAEWESNGGIGILHTSAASTIKKLKELGL